jgi:alkanesulfonate monooxygenase SsuD/methylene tetrahydromethanopterin reductase-like flavin-dependent oxidoreductase (luciferase family)
MLKRWPIMQLSSRIAWKITRERVLAMKEIWTKEVAEYHGKFVNFDPIWCWPKLVQAGGPVRQQASGYHPIR